MILAIWSKLMYYVDSISIGGVPSNIFLHFASVTKSHHPLFTLTPSSPPSNFSIRDEPSWSWMIWKVADSEVEHRDGKGCLTTSEFPTDASGCFFWSNLVGGAVRFACWCRFGGREASRGLSDTGFLGLTGFAWILMVLTLWLAIFAHYSIHTQSYHHRP